MKKPSQFKNNAIMNLSEKLKNGKNFVPFSVNH